MLNKQILQRVGGYIPYGIIAQSFHIKNVNYVLLKMRVDEGMYQRREKVSNIKYFYRLRKFLYKHKMLTWKEKFLHNVK